MEMSTEKDVTELELENILFGDASGFHESLRLHKEGVGNQAFRGTGKDLIVQNRDDEHEEGYDGIDDADLFFLDSNPSAVPTSDLVHVDNSYEEDKEHRGEHGAAWVDSDDERVMVSLASNPRLRKLRIAETEDIINGEEYSKRLRRQFERLYPAPAWASASAAAKTPLKKQQCASRNSRSPKDYSSEDEMAVTSGELCVDPLAKLLQSTTEFIHSSLTTTGRRKLRPEMIDIQRIKDVGLAQPSAITSLTFHPYHPLLLSSGPASTLSLHHVSPHPLNPNPLLTALHIRSNPLTTSTFLVPSGSKIFFSGRKRYFHTWDLSTGAVSKVSCIYGHTEEQGSMESFKLSPCGRWMGLVGSGRKGGGIINVLDAGTCQWIAEVRVEGKGGVADFEWWGDGEGMVVVGKGGEAVEWDGREKRVVRRWTDDGAVGITVIALGGLGGGDETLGGDRWVAVGSASGMVNVYDRKRWRANEASERSKPVRSFGHLTTSTSHLRISPDGQILMMASRWKRDALRLIHLPSCTVYKNWPTSTTPLGRITSVAFSPNSEILAVANEQGKVRLWEIRS